MAGRAVRAELVLERSPFGFTAALLEDGRLAEVDLLDEAAEDVRGQIRLGRVRTIDRELGAAFVDCGLAADAWLGARDARFVVGAGRDAPIERMLSEGQGVLVQVRRGPVGGKAPQVTGDVALAGMYLVLRPRRRDVALPARLARTPAAAGQRERAARLFPGIGVVLRRGASLASDAELLAELARLRDRWQQIEAAASAATPPARLHADDPLQRLLLDRLAPELERIVVGDQATLVRARTWLGKWQPALADRLVSLPDPFEATGVAEQLEEALQPSVPLAGGGSLIIEATAAFTAIDVNGGGRRALEANLGAAAEIARQLRLRRIGGTVVVDFIDLPARAARARVVDALRAALADDPEPVQVFAMSRFGLVEISRRRSGPSLAEMLGRRCPTCAGAGTLPGLRRRAEQLFQEVVRRGPARLRVHAAPDLHDFLQGAGSGGWQAFALRHGGALVLEVDRALPPGDHRIMELS
jgi:Rne/Rng family ribonuclease